MLQEYLPPEQGCSIPLQKQIPAVRDCNNDDDSGNSVIDLFIYFYQTHFILPYPCSSAVAHCYVTVVHLSILGGFMFLNISLIIVSG